MNKEIIEFKHRIGEIKTSIKNFNRVKLKGFSSYEVGWKEILERDERGWGVRGDF